MKKVKLIFYENSGSIFFLDECWLKNRNDHGSENLDSFPIQINDWDFVDCFFAFSSFSSIK